MAAGPACERCGACSYEGSHDGPAKCPFCRKFKKRGTREEIVATLRECEYVLYAAMGYIMGDSVATEDSIKAWIKETIERINEV